MDLVAIILVIGFVVYLAVSTIRDIAHTDPHPFGWCDKTRRVCPLLQRPVHDRPETLLPPPRRVSEAKGRTTRPHGRARGRATPGRVSVRRR